MEEALVPDVGSYPPISCGVENATGCCDASAIETPALLTTPNIPPPLVAPEVDKITQRNARSRELYASRVSKIAGEKKQQLLARRRQLYALKKARGCSNAVSCPVNTVSCSSTPLLAASPLPSLQNLPCAAKFSLNPTQSASLPGHPALAGQTTTESSDSVVPPTSSHTADVFRPMAWAENFNGSDAIHLFFGSFFAHLSDLRALPLAHVILHFYVPAVRADLPSHSVSASTSSWPNCLDGPSSWYPVKSRLKRRNMGSNYLFHQFILLFLCNAVFSTLNFTLFFDGVDVSCMLQQAPRSKKRKPSLNLLSDPPLESMVLPTVQNCECCRAKLFPFEPPNFCCSQGKVSLVSHPMPYALRRLFIGLDEESVEFWKNIRSYNNNFAFTSLGVTYDRDLTMNTRGMYTFRVQGQMHHLLHPLQPNGHPPSGVQLYFYDEHEEISWRMQSTDKFKKSTLQLLMRLLSSNPYTKFFRNLRYVPDLDQKQIILSCTPDLDQRRYNLPSCDQVAAIFRETEYGDEFKRGADIRVYTESDESYNVESSILCSQFWLDLQKLFLTENMRAALDPDFSSFLLRIGEGVEPVDEDGNITLPSEMVVPYDDRDSALNRLTLYRILSLLSLEKIFPSAAPNMASFLLCFFRRLVKHVHTPMPIDAIPAGAIGWDAVVTVLEKRMPYKAHSSPTTFQKFILQDDEGTCVEAICFNHEIQRMGGRLHLFKKYRIRNAQVKKIPEKYKGNDVDVVGAVVKVYPSKELAGERGTLTVQKYVVVNENMHAVTMSLWNDFVSTAGEQIREKLTSFPVVVCNRMRATFFNGASICSLINGIELSTGGASHIQVDPKIEEATHMKQWVENNFKTLQAYVDAGNSIKITLPWIIGWVKVMVTFRHILQNFWYMGCQNCNQSTASELGLVYPCNGCGLSQKASPRCRLEADITDHSDTLRGVLLGEDAEKILAHSALEFMKAGHEVGISQCFPERKLTSLTFTTLCHQTYFPALLNCQNQSMPANSRASLSSACLKQTSLNLVQVVTLKQGVHAEANFNTHAQQGVHASGDAEAISVLPEGVSVSEPKAKLCLDSKLAEADAVKGDSTNDDRKAKRPKRG
ncbi:OLC1v1008907C1 [Oldenlandia corymbosa var. corymbosa]|uniref:OLC1v1008907C1 n=1 Tax=Oldenlandia corymbosa var. corymbosa TaxID=529605 RepID=A0AAV1DML5_OLDCO|nr:OLC1v1008907C1 [Oldenlandia corymbosa var. corymbosa]